MFWLWLIVAILIFAVGSYVIGSLDSDDWDVDGKIALFWALFFGALALPFLLVTAIVVGPFYGLFWLGSRKREKRNAKTDK